MLSHSASYAIRALAYIGAQPTAGWVMNREIATKLELPPQFLTKLLRVLAGQGILLSSRGRTGGFRLARPAHRITLFEIVEPFESLLDRQEECVLGQDICSSQRPCPLHEERISSSRRLAAVLRGLTLAEVADSTRWRGSFPRSHSVAPVPGRRSPLPRRTPRSPVPPKRRTS